MLRDIGALISSLFHDLTQLIVGLAWPAVILVAVLILRRQLPGLLQAATRQGFKLSGAGVSIEVNAAQALPMPAVAFGQLGSSLPSDRFSGSGSSELERLFEPPTPLDYAVIDLGSGQSWLTSRLYLFALMLRRMRSMEEFVFVQANGGVVGAFLAHAPLDRIRWRLAQQQPWLERAYALAYWSVWSQWNESNADPGIRIASDSGRVEYSMREATQVVGTFLTAIQQAKRPDITTSGWVDVTGPQLAGAGPPQQWEERATWIDEILLQQLFKDVLVFDYVIDSADLSASQRTEMILRQDNRFVALVDQSHRFKELIDRDRLRKQVIST